MIPFVDLRRQYKTIKEDIDAAVARVFDTGQFVLGDEVAAFEREFAAFVGAREGVATSTGTSALHLALLAAKIGPGDEVITVPFTFVATAAAIGYSGATPVFVDIDPESFTMDVSKIEDAITPRTRAIMPVHLYGQMADMDPIMEIAKRRGLIVIEDACQAHGASYKGRRAGSIGDFGCFSFYPGKNLGAYGEGGLVTAADPAHAKAVRMLRDWGSEQRYLHVLKGYNYRMEGMQGSVLRVKLRHLEAWNQARGRHAQVYRELLDTPALELPRQVDGRVHVYHVFAVRTPDRASLQRALQASGIQTGIHYPIPVHLQPAHADLGYGPGAFPHSERAANEVLSLPMFPELTHTELEQVCAAVRQEACVL
jgi:dTDP-4-amino-4,6-dideoxygalactose transaminase